MADRTAIGLSPVEAFLCRLDAAPFSTLSRIVIGFTVFPVRSAMFGSDASKASLLFVFLTILALIRVVPLGFRRLVPFSESVRNAWAHRRLMAKRYDSYQWQKLFWIGWGLVAGMAWTNDFDTAPRVVAGASLAAGALGIVAWHRRKALIASRRPAR